MLLLRALNYFRFQQHGRSRPVSHITAISWFIIAPGNQRGSSSWQRGPVVRTATSRERGSQGIKTRGTVVAEKSFQFSYERAGMFEVLRNYRFFKVYDPFIIIHHSFFIIFFPLFCFCAEIMWFVFGHN